MLNAAVICRFSQRKRVERARKLFMLFNKGGVTTYQSISFIWRQPTLKSTRSTFSPSNLAARTRVITYQNHQEIFGKR
jgi:hypothetical protein